MWFKVGVCSLHLMADLESLWFIICVGNLIFDTSACKVSRFYFISALYFLHFLLGKA